MLTIKAEIQRDKLRQDGTYNVKIRFTKGKQVKRLSTSLFVTKADLTDKFTIKEDSLIKQEADRLILHYRTLFNEMHLETEALDVNEIVARLTSREESDKPVDFIQFAKEWIANSTLKGAANYTSALNSLIRFNKSEKLYTHQITSDFLQDFMNFLLYESRERAEMLKKKGKRVPSTRCTSLYLMSIRKLFNEAVKQYNKPDQGLIRIKNTPFAYFHIPKQEATRKRAITAEQIRKIAQLWSFFHYLCKRPKTDNMTFDIQKTEYIAILAGIDCLPPVREGEVIDTSFVEQAQKTAIEHFAHRFPDLFQENRDKYKMFLESTIIQTQLSEWKLDRIKFWYLHLFVMDYATDSFSGVTIFEKLSTKQYIEKLIKTLENTDMEDFCLDIRISKEKLTTQNPWIVAALLSALKQDFPFDWANGDTVVSKKITEDVEHYNTARMKFATELYSHFLGKHLSKAQRGRNSFIGKFLYLADFIKDERYWYGCKPTLARFCKKYEIAQHPKVIVDGTEYIAIPFDAGKDLADRIKKNTTSAQVRHSFYFSAFDE